MTKSKSIEGAELTPYRTHQKTPSIFEEKFIKAQQKLKNIRHEKEKNERERQEQEQQNHLKIISLLNEINDVIYPLELKITNKAWDRDRDIFIFRSCVAIYSKNNKINPQYICHECEIFTDLTKIIERASFAELVEELSDPNLKRNKMRHGPLPEEIVVRRMKIIMTTIFGGLSLLFLI